VAGGVFQMISHGIVSGALFSVSASSTTDAYPRDRGLRGLVNRMPLYALVFMVFTMAMSGCPARRASSANS